MFGATIVFLVVLVIVGSYITLVNRMLRSDEHWAESSPKAAYEVARPPAVASIVASPAHA